MNLASRLAGKAEPGQILITERTLVTAREIVDATEFEQVELRGVTRPIRIYGVEESAAT